MKRPYREGDWFAVPLGDGRFAAGIVTHGTRKAVCGSFFGPPRDGLPRIDDLTISDPARAIWAGRFSDRAIVEQRWPVLGAQPGFVRGDWARPDQQAAAQAGYVERCLAARLTGAAATRSRLSVLDLSEFVVAHTLARFGDGSQLQWRRELAAGELCILSEYVASHPNTRVRVYGSASSQLHVLASWAPFDSLEVDGSRLGDDLASFASVRRLVLDEVPRNLSHVLGEFPSLQTLVIRARGGSIDAAELERCDRLRTLVLRDARVTHTSALRLLSNLRSLDLQGVWSDDTDALSELPLTTLRLARVVPIHSLAGLAGRPTLRSLAIEDLFHIDDLSPISQLRDLESLDIRGLWQFDVADAAFVLEMSNLRRLRIDIGGRRKNVELYRRRPLAEPLPAE